MSNGASKTKTAWIIGIVAMSILGVATIVTGVVTLFQLYVLMPNQAHYALKEGEWRTMNVAMMEFKNQDEFMAAELKLNDLLTDNYKNIVPNYLIGSLYQQQGQNEKALQHYQNTLTAADESWYQKTIYSYVLDDAHAAMAFIYYVNNDSKAALNELNQVNALEDQEHYELLDALDRRLKNPRRADYRFELGKELSHILYIKKAREEMLAAEELSTDPQFQMKIKNYLKTKMPVAITELTPAVRYYTRAGNYHEDNERYTASRFYERAIAENPNFEWAHHQLGNVYLQMKEYNKALKCAQKAAALNPNFYLPHLTMGDVELERQNYNRAITHFNRALTIVGNLKDEYHLQLTANIENQLGYTYEIQSQNALALEHYKQALEVADEYSEDYQYAQTAIRRIKAGSGV